MVRMGRLQKETKPPGVGGGGRKVKKTYMNQNQRGDTASKGVGVACETIRRSTLHLTDMKRKIKQIME